MFNVGDKIVYPLHGAGVIEDIEEIEVDGSKQKYYVLFIPIGNLRIKISSKKTVAHGLREVHIKEDIEDIITSIKGILISIQEDWNKRYKENNEKLKTGLLKEAVEVYRNLRHRESGRGLSAVEKKQMQTTKNIIVSEIMLSTGMDKEQGETLLDKLL